MMRMSEHEDREQFEQEVRLWLDSRDFPDELCVNLPTYYKSLLHKLVCSPTQPVSDSQRRDLYRKLCSPGSRAGRDSADPVDSMTDEQLRAFFSPPYPRQSIFHVDWGCDK